jgi:hypothetical protein
MSHHFDTPTAREDPRICVNDFYLFDGAAGTTVVAMTVNPDAGLSAPETFRDEGLYAFRFDLNGDAREELTFKFSVMLTLAANQALSDGVAPDRQRMWSEFPYFGEPYTHDEQHGLSRSTACDKVTSRTKNDFLVMATINWGEGDRFFFTPDRRVPCPTALRGHVFRITAECGRRRACSHTPRVLPRYGRTPESVSKIQSSGARPCVDVLLRLPATVSVQRSQPNVAPGSDRPGQANTRV